MLAQLLSSTSNHHDAITNCIDILAQLGEVFPPQSTLMDFLPPKSTLDIVMDKLAAAKPLVLESLTLEQVKSLPLMTDTTKLQAMKFLTIICSISFKVAPALLGLASVRMIKLTIQHGFCEDSIVGLVWSGYSLVSTTSLIYCTTSNQLLMMHPGHYILLQK